MKEIIISIDNTFLTQIYKDTFKIFISLFYLSYQLNNLNKILITIQINYYFTLIN